MPDDLKLTRFEQEMMRRLRALPFEVQQHVSRYILRLQKEHGTVPRDPRAPRAPGEPPPPVWDMTRDELDEIRRELEGEGDEQ